MQKVRGESQSANNLPRKRHFTKEPHRRGRHILCAQARSGVDCAYARKMWEHARSGGDLRMRAQAVGGHVMQVYLRMRAQTMGGCVSFFAFSHALSGRAKTAQNDDVG